jgi:hypothetical protein
VPFIINLFFQCSSQARVLVEIEGYNKSNSAKMPEIEVHASLNQRAQIFKPPRERVYARLR